MRMLLLMLPLLIAQVSPTPGTPTQARTTGTIKGVVRVSGSSNGIPDVEVTLIAGASPIAPASSPSVATDAEGRFSFPNVAFGLYTLRAQRTGYFPENVDPAAPPAFQVQTSPVTVSAAAPDADVSMPLAQGGTISGRVLDSQGRPAAGVPMLVVRPGYQDGRKVLLNATPFLPSGAGLMTNDRGEYRLFWYPAGEYYVKTDALQSRPGAGATTTSAVPLPTFYPGTRDATRALPVTVGAGQEVSGIDFIIETAPGFKVSGKVKLSVPGGRTMPDGRVSRSISSFFVVDQNAETSDRIPLTNNSISSAVNSDQVDFDFELRGISPGRYNIYPLFTDGQPSGGVSGLPNYYSTRMPVEVIDRDVTGLTGEIHRFPDVTFRFITKGDPPANTPPQQAIRPSLQLRIQEAIGNLISAGAAATPPVGPDGSVVFGNLFPSKYKILVPITLQGYYVADIRQGVTSLYNDGILTVTGEAPSGPVEITLSSGAGQVRGVVRNAKGEPAAAARVVLIPQAPRRSNSLLYRRTSSAAGTGQFTFGGIAPGEYKVFAWERLLNGAEENAEFLAGYETRSRIVTINPGANNTDLQIDLITDSPQTK